MPVVDVEGVGLVEFPDDMTDDEIVAAIESDLAPAPASAGPQTRPRATPQKQAMRNVERMSEGQKWGRAAGLAARDLSSGALFLPQMLTNAAAYGGNMGLSALDTLAEQVGGNVDARLPYGTGEELADALGLPTAVTDDEKLSGKFGRLVGGIYGGWQPAACCSLEAALSRSEDRRRHEPRDAGAAATAAGEHVVDRWARLVDCDGHTGHRGGRGRQARGAATRTRS